MPEYSDIELAIEYVSGAPEGTNRVVYDKVARRFFYASDFSGENEIPGARITKWKSRTTRGRRVTRCSV
ncbi:MAG: hypothetical protein HY343_09505 [Lentisphaerae bacterium]|nr:hypothetical protein [Lentisphaerota bacterium]